MNTKLLAALAATVIGCATSLTANADDGWKRGHHHKHWKQGHGYHQHGYYYGPVVRERVIVSRPVYVERPVYVAPRPVYVAPPVYYAPPRPGIVVSVNVPPIVFPIY
jgi:hypothetical protein